MCIPRHVDNIFFVGTFSCTILKWRTVSVCAKFLPWQVHNNKKMLAKTMVNHLCKYVYSKDNIPLCCDENHWNFYSQSCFDGVVLRQVMIEAIPPYCAKVFSNKSLTAKSTDSIMLSHQVSGIELLVPSRTMSQ